MRASLEIIGPYASIELALDPEDELEAKGQWGMPIELVTNRARLVLDGEMEPHPDLVALALLLTLGPWITKRLQLHTPVSSQFAQAVHRSLGISLGPVDDQLAPRGTGPNFGLAYSGGPDSLAAGALFDPDLTRFHFSRIRHRSVPNRATHLRSDVHLSLVQRANRHRGGTVIIKGDIEFLARPFPTYAYWATVAIGAVLAADRCGLGGLVFGKNIGDCYVHLGSMFDRAGDSDWVMKDVFGAAGIRVVFPLAGVSELVSMKIARRQEDFDLTRSCQLGPPERPCRRCEKCLRKSLIESCLDEAGIDRELIEGALAIPSVRAKLAIPLKIPQMHTYAHAFARLPELRATSLSPFVVALAVAPDITEWVERAYSPALADWLPDSKRDDVSVALAEHAPSTNDRDRDIIESWPNHLQGLTDVDLSTPLSLLPPSTG